MLRSAPRKAALLGAAVLVLAAQPLLAPPASAQSVTAPMVWTFSHAGALPSGWSYAPAKFCAAHSNVWVRNGAVVLRAGQVGSHQYCGARIQTNRTFNPPFTISIRARFALPAGLHTGATLYGADGQHWPWNGEADLDEMTARTPTTDHVRLWTQKASASTPRRCGDQADPAGVDTAAWHVYTTTFGVARVIFSLDGKPFFTTSRARLQQLGCTWPFDQPAGLRLFLTVADGGWGGPPHGPGYPALQEFDYVRILPLSG
jgi:hypothetical protein